MKARTIVLFAVLLAMYLIIMPSASAQIGKRLRRQQQTPEPRSVYHTLLFNGIQRRYLLHVPPSYTGREPVALVIVLHGTYGDGMIAEERSQFSPLSDREGFIVVYPDGMNRHWNDGRDSKSANVDDVGFIATLIENLSGQYALDRLRVYVSGMSNGAIMSHRLAAELSDKIAAIAPVAGNIAEGFEKRFTPQSAVSVIIFNGTEDPFVPWSGGEVPSFVGGRVISVKDSIRFWVQINHCAENPVISEEPDRNPSDGTRVYREAYQCPYAEVVLYRVKGGGHAWPGGPTPFLKKGGRVSHDIDATELMWEFFKHHPKK